MGWLGWLYTDVWFRTATTFPYLHQPATQTWGPTMPGPHSGYRALQWAGLCWWVNSWRPSDTIWCQRSGSTLAQVMACCLTAPSHYLNQCWIRISEVLRHLPGSNFTASAQTIILYNEFESCSLKLPPHLPGANELLLLSSLLFPLYIKDLHIIICINFQNSCQLCWDWLCVDIFEVQCFLYMSNDPYSLQLMAHGEHGRSGRRVPRRAAVAVSRDTVYVVARSTEVNIVLEMGRSLENVTYYHVEVGPHERGQNCANVMPESNW